MCRLDLDCLEVSQVWINAGILQSVERNVVPLIRLLLASPQLACASCWCMPASAPYSHTSSRGMSTAQPDVPLRCLFLIGACMKGGPLSSAHCPAALLPPILGWRCDTQACAHCPRAPHIHTHTHMHTTHVRPMAACSCRLRWMCTLCWRGLTPPPSCSHRWTARRC